LQNYVVHNLGMEDAADQGHQQNYEREEGQDRIGRNREGEGMNLGSHEIAQSGADQPPGTDGRRADGTLPYSIGRGERRDGGGNHRGSFIVTEACRDAQKGAELKFQCVITEVFLSLLKLSRVTVIRDYGLEIMAPGRTQGRNAISF
jgi:hypothetical protein